jgi:hypothetical protein
MPSGETSLTAKRPLTGVKRMNAILGVVALLLVFVGFMLWECCGWISARAELVKQQARKLKLENDALESTARLAPHGAQ